MDTNERISKEQIEKAAEAARATYYPKSMGWANADEISRDEWRNAVKAAAPYLQPDPQPVPEDVVEAMRKIYNAEARKQMLDPALWMTAAARVCIAWCREKDLAEPTEEQYARFDSDVFTDGGQIALKNFLAHRRSLPLLPEKTLEERIVVFGYGDKWCVVVDKDRNHPDSVYDLPTEATATRYRTGLIAELRGKEGK